MPAESTVVASRSSSNTNRGSAVKKQQENRGQLSAEDAAEEARSQVHGHSIFHDSEMWQQMWRHSIADFCDSKCDNFVWEDNSDMQQLWSQLWNHGKIARWWLNLQRRWFCIFIKVALLGLSRGWMTISSNFGGWLSTYLWLVPPRQILAFDWVSSKKLTGREAINDLSSKADWPISLMESLITDRQAQVTVQGLRITYYSKLFLRFSPKIP